HLLFAADAVTQPVGNVLAGNEQGGAVFHQADIVDIRHFGTTDALVDPAHHVAKDTLGVVVQFLLVLGGRQFGIAQQRDGQDVVQGCARTAGQVVLYQFHVDLMVVQYVQGGAGR